MYFTKLIKESASDNQLTVLDFMIYSLNTVSQFHLYHFLTKDAQRHEALGEFYNNLNDEIDSFTEYFLGENDIYGNVSAPLMFRFETDPSLTNILSSIESYDSYVLKIRGILDPIKEGSLIDAIDDIKELISKLKYKLKMS